MERFYFTFGSEGHPYYGGWIIIIAPNADIAREIFGILYPSEGGFMKFASMYSEATWKKTSMYEKGSNLGRGCYRVITLNIEERDGEVE